MYTLDLVITHIAELEHLRFYCVLTNVASFAIVYRVRCTIICLLVTQMLFQQVRLTPGTDTFNTWTNPPISPYDDIYVFNITNPVEFNNGAKPSLQLVGPFVYRLYFL